MASASGRKQWKDIQQMADRSLKRLGLLQWLPVPSTLCLVTNIALSVAWSLDLCPRQGGDVDLITQTEYTGQLDLHFISNLYPGNSFLASS